MFANMVTKNAPLVITIFIIDFNIYTSSYYFINKYIFK